jgi:hypothetical protein
LDRWFGIKKKNLIEITKKKLGMNVRVPFQSDVENSLAPFFVLFGIMLIIILTAFGIFWRKGWL